MTERPRPQYGEYATPEDQAAAMGMPERVTPTAPLEQAPPVAATPYPGAGVATARTPRTWDRVLTIILLALGAYTVVNYFDTFANLGRVLTETFVASGYEAFQSVDLANQLGVVANIVVMSLFALTALLTIASLRAKRITFWIPLVGGVLAFIAVVVIMAFIVVADPSFQAQVNELGRQ